MKKTFYIIILFFSFVCFSQTKVKSGYITFNSNVNLAFKNLIIEKDTVMFFNEFDSEMSYSLESVKKIVDNTGAIIYEIKKQIKEPKSVQKIENKDSISIEKKEIITEMQYVSPQKILLKDEILTSEKIENMMKKNSYALELYKKGKGNVVLSDWLIGGGIGMFVGGGLMNLSKANNNEKGSPVVLVLGVASTIIGIPVRSNAVKNIKDSVDIYNTSLRKTTFIDKADVKLSVSFNSIGLNIRF